MLKNYEDGKMVEESVVANMDTFEMVKFFFKNAIPHTDYDVPITVDQEKLKKYPYPKNYKFSVGYDLPLISKSIFDFHEFIDKNEIDLKHDQIDCYMRAYSKNDRMIWNWTSKETLSPIGLNIMKEIMMSKQGMVSLHPRKNSFKAQFGISYDNDKVRFSFYLPVYIYTNENDSPKLAFDELPNYAKCLSALKEYFPSENRDVAITPIRTKLENNFCIEQDWDWDGSLDILPFAPYAQNMMWPKNEDLKTVLQTSYPHLLPYLDSIKETIFHCPCSLCCNIERYNEYNKDLVDPIEEAKYSNLIPKFLQAKKLYATTTRREDAIRVAYKFSAFGFELSFPAYIYMEE